MTKKLMSGVSYMRTVLLNDSQFVILSRVLGGTDLYKTYKRALKERVAQEGSHTSGDRKEWIRALATYSTRLAFADILFRYEKSKHRLTHPTDAEPRTVTDDGKIYVISGGPLESRVMTVSPNVHQEYRTQFQTSY